jgi:hypothetical protein
MFEYALPLPYCALQTPNPAQHSTAHHTAHHSTHSMMQSNSTILQAGAATHSPLLPAFCHIMLLIARSASTKVSWNQAAPADQGKLRYSVRKAAATIRTDCCIHPVSHSSRMPASRTSNQQQATTNRTTTNRTSNHQQNKQLLKGITNTKCLMHFLFVAAVCSSPRVHKAQII